MASKIKVDQLETADGSGTIALQNQLSGMTTASLPALGSAQMPTGSVLQVKNVEYSTETSITTQTETVTGYTLNITPSATSSKILINVAFPLRKNNTSGTDGLKIVLYKNGSSHKILNWWWGYHNDDNKFSAFAHQVLDSPSTTSQITYAIYVRTNASNSFILNDTGAIGSMTLTEIAG